MLTRKLAPALAVLGALLFLGNGRAEAAPTLLLPDTTFASTNTSSFHLASSSPLSYSLSVSTETGGALAIDSGTGFSSTTGSITVSGGTVTVSTGSGNISGTITSSVATPSPVGLDVLGRVTVTSSTLSGVSVGGKMVLDLHVFNFANGQGAVKGDIAPVVPEPTSLSLLLLGTIGAAGAARRRRSV